MKGVFKVLFECEVREKISTKTGNPYNVLAVKVIENPPTFIEFFLDANQTALLAVADALQ